MIGFYRWLSSNDLDLKISYLDANEKFTANILYYGYELWIKNNGCLIGECGCGNTVENAIKDLIEKFNGRKLVVDVPKEINEKERLEFSFVRI